MQPTEQKRAARFRSFGIGRVLSLLLGAVCVSIGWGCDSAPPPTLPSAPPPSSSTPLPPDTFARYHLSGRVTDQARSAITGALVEVDYGKGGRNSSPPSECPPTIGFCWLTALTNDRGEYAVEFEPGPLAGRGIGYVYSRHDGYETDIQWLPTGTASAVQNFRLRPVRSINAGAATVVSIESDSSLCSDLEDSWVLSHRCAVVRIDAVAGTLVVEARAAEGGSVLPIVFEATTGSYAGDTTHPAPGTVSIPVLGGTYRIFVGIPDGTAPLRVDVLTLLR
jgi:hypothetical protein